MLSRTSNLLLRIAIAFAFLYVAYASWAHPSDWIGYIPAFVKDFGLPENVLMMSLLGVHVILALWILSGWRIFIPSFAAAIFLGGVVYFNSNQLNVLFRDISLAIASLALAFSSSSRY